MTKKLFYMIVLICGLSIFSSAKQICIGSVKENNPKKPVCIKKAPVKIKTVASKGQRPFNFFLINL
ncbi:MAG: hypothetical protein ACXWWA_13810 [Chitinophagaceae bacterium]